MEVGSMFNIVFYATADDIGTILVEGLSRADAMQRAADLNTHAVAGSVYAIERW